MKGKLCDLTEDELQWYGFWYDLKSYLHPSWLLSVAGQPADNLRLKPNSSQYLWNTAYPLLCHQFNLPHSYLDNELSESFWLGFLPILVQYPVDSMKIAGMAYYTDEKPAHIDKTYTDDPYYRESVKLGRSLCLAGRCQLIDESTIEEVGLYFLYHALKQNHLSYWLRVRLAFDRELVLLTEKKDVAHLLSDSTRRTFQRLWKMINHLLLKSDSVAN
ncbi:MAG: hypothetical protein ACJAUP_001766 [Cellvibrionaceae bacterium]